MKRYKEQEEIIDLIDTLEVAKKFLGGLIVLLTIVLAGAIVNFL